MDYIILLLAFLLYWELTGLFCFALIRVHTYINPKDFVEVRSISHGRFLKCCLVLGPLVIVIMLYVQVKDIVTSLRNRG